MFFEKKLIDQLKILSYEAAGNPIKLNYQFIHDKFNQAEEYSKSKFPKLQNIFLINNNFDLNSNILKRNDSIYVLDSQVRTKPLTLKLQDQEKLVIYVESEEEAEKLAKQIFKNKNKTIKIEQHVLEGLPREIYFFNKKSEDYYTAIDYYLKKYPKSNQYRAISTIGDHVIPDNLKSEHQIKIIEKIPKCKISYDAHKEILEITIDKSTLKLFEKAPSFNANGELEFRVTKLDTPILKIQSPDFTIDKISILDKKNNELFAYKNIALNIPYKLDKKTKENFSFSTYNIQIMEKLDADLIFNKTKIKKNNFFKPQFFRIVEPELKDSQWVIAAAPYDRYVYLKKEKNTRKIVVEKNKYNALCLINVEEVKINGTGSLMNANSHYEIYSHAIIIDSQGADFYNIHDNQPILPVYKGKPFTFNTDSFLSLCYIDFESSGDLITYNFHQYKNNSAKTRDGHQVFSSSVWPYDNYTQQNSNFNFSRYKLYPSNVNPSVGIYKTQYITIESPLNQLVQKNMSFGKYYCDEHLKLNDCVWFCKNSVNTIKNLTYKIELNQEAPIILGYGNIIVYIENDDFFTIGKGLFLIAKYQIPDNKNSWQKGAINTLHDNNQNKFIRDRYKNYLNNLPREWGFSHETRVGSNFSPLSKVHKIIRKEQVNKSSGATIYLIK